MSQWGIIERKIMKTVTAVQLADAEQSVWGTVI